MGLSDEERLSRVIWGFIHLRGNLRKITEIIDKDRKSALSIVNNWIDSIDLIMGKFIRQSNTSTHYWILGSNDNSYESFFSDHYDLGKISTGKDGYLITKPKFGSLDYYRDIPISEFIDILLKSHNRMENVIALFWDAYKYIDVILYGAYRYKDDLIQPFEEDLLKFIGRMANERFQLFQSCDLLQEITKIADIEVVIQCKFKLFNMIMRERSNDNYNEARKSSKTSQAKIKLDSREDYYPEIQEIMDYLRDTSLHILQKDIENRIEQEGRRAQEYDDTVVSNTLSIIGPKSRTYAELMNIIDNMEQVTKEEYESAATELETCYSCFVGDYIPPKQKRKTVKSVKRATKRSTNKRQSS